MLAVVARHFTEEELLEACRSVEVPEPGKIDFHTDRKNLGGGADATVLASLIVGGGATIAAFINGLFLLAQQRMANRGSSRREAHGGLVVRMTKKTIRIRHEEHMVKLQELEEDSVLEIRLE